MNFGKLHHWAMMAAMILMGGGAALAMYGAKTNFLHIGLGYVKHIFVGGFEAIGPGLKAIGVATGNLLSMVGIDPGGLLDIDPGTMAEAGKGYMSHGLSAPLKTSALDTLHMGDQFASAACAPGPGQEFGLAAHYGGAIMDACAPSMGYT
ncbi:MAG: hypothetical protein WBK55_04440 [Alphaproteobacteria bacterium]